MKVLFFIHGSIRNRIDSWGVDNYKKLLEQDVVFFGPIIEDSYTYKDNKLPIIKINTESSINKLFEKLPNDWYPDVVVFDPQAINLFYDIYECPVKSYLFVRDSWGDIFFNKGAVELFDFYIYNVVDRASYKKYNSSLLPLKWGPVTIPSPSLRKIDYAKRKIDILAIANYDDKFYHERYKLFAFIAKEIPKKYNVKFVTNLKRHEIHKVYRNAKIVIDWAHTLSNRSYEATLNGCLFFSHEVNPLINEYWTAWEEYVPFNNANVIDLLLKYLNNDLEAQKVTANAFLKIKNDVSNYGELIMNHLDIIANSDVNPELRINYNKNIDKSILWHRLSSMFYFNYHFNQFNVPDNWKEVYYQRINNSINHIKNSDYYTPIIEAARMSFLLKDYDKSMIYLERLESVFPDYPWIYYLRGRIFQFQSQFELATQSHKVAIFHAEQNPDLLKEYPMPFFEKEIICDARRVVSLIWYFKNDVNTQLNTFLNMCYTAMGDITHSSEAAIALYKKAYNAYLEPNIVHLLIEIYYVNKEYNKTIEILKEGLIDSPYDYRMLIYKAIILLKLNKKDEYTKLIKDTCCMLNCFQGNRKMKYFNLSLKGVLFISYLSTKLSVSILLKMKNKL